MNFKSRLIYLIIVAGMLAWIGTPSAQVTHIQLLLGEQKAIDVTNVVRVAVGDPSIADVKIIDEREMLVTGLSAGVTSLTIWDKAGNKQEFSIKVLAKDPKEIKKEIEYLMKDIEGVRIEVVGDRVFIDGEVFREKDLKRAEKIAAVYPQVTILLEYNKAYLQMERMILVDFSVYRVSRTGIFSLGLNWNEFLNGSSLQYEYQQLISGGTPYTARPQRMIMPDGSIMELTQFEESEAGGMVTISHTFNPLKMNQEDNRIRYLDNHQVTIRSGETAEYQVGGEIPYEVQQALGYGTIQFKSYGTIIKVSPEIDKIDNIICGIEAEVSELDWANAVRNVPALNVVKTKTKVNLKSDQSVMLGGYLVQRIQKGTDGIPGFSKIPILGYLFGSKMFRDDKTDGVVFITPSLISPVEEPKGDPKIKGVLDNFEEADFKL